MFLTLLFAEHMLPWGLKLSYSWPFVALRPLSFSQGPAQWGRGEPGKAGEQKVQAQKVGESKTPIDCLSEHGKRENQCPKVRPSTPPHPPGHQSLTKAARWLHSSFEVALVPEPWLTAHLETKCVTLSCTSQAESSGAVLRAQTHGTDQFFLGGRPWRFGLIIFTVDVSCCRIAGVEMQDGMLAWGMKTGKHPTYLFLLWTWPFACCFSCRETAWQNGRRFFFLIFIFFNQPL